ncbi:MAG: hypothetical protein IT372_12095 [Polyangiaceae bacterium]|nr:hypothetical protein [Polyangiaceae bacterium]
MDPFEDDDDDGRPSRVIRALVFVGSALLAAAALRFAWFEPVIAAAVLGAAGVIAGARWIGRRRLRRLLRAGDVGSLLQRWSPAFRRIPHPATMAPLMTAMAFAAYGWVEKARAAMAMAERGPAWDAAIEHRLFVDTLLSSFEGDREAALENGRRLERLPPPQTSPALRDRVLTLRAAAAALSRAFAHESRPGDRQLLELAGELSPLVFWAMRYAAAVVAIDEGEVAEVAELLEGAPAWPEESMFRAFHDEIADRAGIAKAMEA